MKEVIWMPIIDITVITNNILRVTFRRLFIKGRSEGFKSRFSMRRATERVMMPMTHSPAISSRMPYKRLIPLVTIHSYKMFKYFSGLSIIKLSLVIKYLSAKV